MKDFLKKEKHSRMSAILVLMTNHFLCNFQSTKFFRIVSWLIVHLFYNLILATISEENMEMC